MEYLAYIDPGTGSLVLQMIIAGALGTIAFFRGTIAGFFSAFFNKKDQSKTKTEKL